MTNTVTGAEQPAPCNLENLRELLLAPRPIVRDEDGHLTHPALPICDERVRYDELLAVFGIEAHYVGMESDDSKAYERYSGADGPDCSYWTPAPPSGDGWLLLAIYDTEDGPYALFGRAMPKEAWPRYYGASVDLTTHLVRQIAFSFCTFGPGRRTKGVIDHIRRELREIEDEPHRLEEWIDVVLLALDGAWRTELGHYNGHRTTMPVEAVAHTAGRITAALVAKQAKNETRDWPDWRTADLNKAIEHKRG